ncbi:MAG: choice-of-anchor tandem repeat GloVer-containing protein [Candidatus Korobacteraceae bacterium]
MYDFAGGGNDGQNPLDGVIFDTAGNLYGTTAVGGGSANCTNGCGTVFELSPSGSGWTEKVLYKFQGPSDGENPNAGVVMDTAGNLYGNTWQGGPGGGGTVWELSPSGSNYTFTLLYSVPGSGFAVGRLARDSHGNLYEALQNGGANNNGQIFELTPSNGNWIFTDLHDFTNGNDGGEPIGGVVLDSSGNIYGTALFGGANACGGGSYGCGTVWEITP